MPLQVRAATVADLPTLLPLMVAFNAYEEIAWSAEQGAPVLKHLIESPALGFVGCICEGGAVVGYFVLTWGFDLEWGGRDAVMTELFLEPAARGKGLGKMVLEEVDRIAREQGARAMHLLVRPENVNAERLYLSAGFKQSPRKFLTRRL